LITSLTSLLIRKGLKKPLALIMSYPAQYVSEKRFVPSLLLSLDDILLPIKFLKHVMAAYSGSSDEQLDASKCELMSPLLTQDEVLKQFPQTLV
jgi:hypothetical protein